MSKYSQSASLPVNFEGFINARQPQDVFTFFDDFMGPSWSIDADTVATTSTTAAQPWTYTNVGTGIGSLALVDATYSKLATLGGVLRVTTIGTVDTGANLQVTGQQFVIDQDCGLPLYFEARFRTADVSNTDIFVGLSKVDAEIIATGLDDGVGFLLESGTLYNWLAESSAEKKVSCGITEADGAAATNAGWVRVSFYFDGKNTVSFFTDANDDGEFDFKGSYHVGTTLDYLPDDQTLTPTIEVIVGSTASAETADFDYVLCAQQRYHA